MAIDPYAPCPCGSGKKLKFCCADLAGEIEKIHHQITADQPRAALQRIEQLRAKHPDRASLIDLHASIQLSLHDFDGAAQTIKSFLDLHPKVPAAHAQTAILLAAKDHPIQAAAKVQDALERVQDDLPQRVLEAIGAVGSSLLMSGNIVAGQAHLVLYSRITPEEENPAAELLSRFVLESGIPILIREQLPLRRLTEEAPEKQGFDEALDIASTGRWRRAEARFAKLDQQEPSVIFNRALLCGWLGDTEQMVEGLHKYAKLDVPRAAAEEAEAVAHFFDEQLSDPTIDSVVVEFPIHDEDRLHDALKKDARVEQYDFDSQQQQDHDAPRPRGAYVLLDRPALENVEDLRVDDIPNIVAFVAYYGKQTDREARLAVTTDRDQAFDQALSIVTEIGGEAIGPAGEEKVVDQKPAAERALSWRWRLPDEAPLPVRLELLAERRRRAILEDWTAAPLGATGGKSPSEAAADPAMKIPVSAAVLNLEQTAAVPSELELFDELREKLGLPRAEQIDPVETDLDELSLAHLARIDAAKLSDGQLTKLLERTTAAGANVAAMIAAEELVGREVDIGVQTAAYFRLIRGQLDPNLALQWVERAETWAAEQGESLAPWAVMKLRIQIQRGDADAAQTVFAEIRDKHYEQPGVAEAVARILLEAGVVPATQPVESSDPADISAPQLAAAAPKSEIWTPDSEGASSAAGESKESALWLP